MIKDDPVATTKSCSFCLLVISFNAFLLMYVMADTGLAQNAAATSFNNFAQQNERRQPAKPYQLSTRIHLQHNSNRGYLVLRVEMPKDSHIYSLTQKGDLRPTKLTVSKSNQFRLLGNFAPDRPAEITKFDPVFKQQVEKHKGMVQFFAPIEVAKGVSIDKLNPEIVMEGQVCTAANICMPILGDKVPGKFAGYFQRTANNATVGSPLAPLKNPSQRRTASPQGGTIRR